MVAAPWPSACLPIAAYHADCVTPDTVLAVLLAKADVSDLTRRLSYRPRVMAKTPLSPLPSNRHIVSSLTHDSS